MATYLIVEFRMSMLRDQMFSRGGDTIASVDGNAQNARRRQAVGGLADHGRDEIILKDLSDVE